jgi:hypothetical protein
LGAGGGAAPQAPLRSAATPLDSVGSGDQPSAGEHGFELTNVDRAPDSLVVAAEHLSDLLHG